MLLAMIVAGAGCAARHPAAAIPPASDSKTDNEACLPDPKDRCTAFSEGCPELDADTDGCPVVHVELTSACQPREPTLRALAGVARDIHDKTRLTTLRIVAHLKGCGEFVRQALVREGWSWSSFHRTRPHRVTLDSRSRRGTELPASRVGNPRRIVPRLADSRGGSLTRAARTGSSPGRTVGGHRGRHTVRRYRHGPTRIGRRNRDGPGGVGSP